MKDFVHLHLHSEYSLLDGICRISDIPSAVLSAGQKAVAITDHGVMYGAVSFYNTCRKSGVKPIIGCEVYVANNSRYEKSGNNGDYSHMVLLVKDDIGYKNLIYMLSKSFTEGFYRKPRIDFELLSEHNKGLIGLSSCLHGYIPKLIIGGNLKGAEEYALKLDRIFKRGNFYLELQNQGIDNQKMVNECIAGISEHTGIPMVATNNVHYLKKEDASAHAVAMCIQKNGLLSDGRMDGFETDEFYLKSADEMYQIFGSYEGACENTVKIAEKCNFDFKFGETKLPKFTDTGGLSENEYLKNLVYKGLEKHEKNGDIVYSDNYTFEDYKYRIEYELLVVSSMGYAGYYLIVSDFVNYAKNHGIATGPGRGSGAGSLLAYLIGITEVDPLKFNLLFESFLNKQRISMPDFDIDFCYRRRDEVIKYVTEKYGNDHVAQIVTFGTMAAKAVLRDVGRVMGISYPDVDKIVYSLPESKGGVTLSEALEDKNFRKYYDSDNLYRNLIDTAISLEGMPRNASTHAAGVVITDRPIYEYVPLSMNGETVVTQFDMDTIASLGLLKFDFLALRYLTIISDTEKEIKKFNPNFDLSRVPLDDPETYDLISEGKTNGLFQLESDGMRQLLISMRPENICDIMTALALYRPGPMDAIPKFLGNRKNRKNIKYKFDCLPKILDETCGCIVYQEQVMQIFREIAGYTYGKADIVRRAIAKKKPGIIEKERENFISGAVNKGYDADDALEIYEQMTDFANYGFKKSHAAAYAIISFRTAYLKAHYAPMYYASLISSVLGNIPKMAEYISECKKMGIQTLPPDINKSAKNFTAVDNTIRYGLCAIKNVGEQFIEKVISERIQAPFSSFIDFISRMSGTELNRRQIESLIKSGAFDSLGVFRSRLLSSAKEIIESFQNQNRDNIVGQLDMFSSSNIEFHYPDIPEFNLREKLSFEKESVGMYFSGHILDDYIKHIEYINSVSISNVLNSFTDDNEKNKKYTENQLINVAGVLTHISQKTIKNGDTMAFATIEDRSSEIELVIFPKVLTEYGAVLSKNEAVSVNSQISLKDGTPKLIVHKVIKLMNNSQFNEYLIKNNNNKAKIKLNNPSLNNFHKQILKKLYIKVPDREGMKFKRALAITEIFQGTTPVIVYDLSLKKYYKCGLNIVASDFVIKELKEILGFESVILK